MQSNCLPSQPLQKFRNTGGGSLSSPVDLPYPGIKQGSAALQVDSLPAALLGKPTNMGMCVCVYIYIYIKCMCVYTYNTYDVIYTHNI